MNSLLCVEMDDVADIDIENGTFKYILIKLTSKNAGDGKIKSKTVVRGYNWAEYHGE